MRLIVLYFLGKSASRAASVLACCVLFLIAATTAGAQVTPTDFVTPTFLNLNAKCLELNPGVSNLTVPFGTPVRLCGVAFFPTFLVAEGGGAFVNEPLSHGTISFFEGTRLLGAGQVSDGSDEGCIETGSFSPGIHTIAAYFSGVDLGLTDYLNSRAVLTLTVTGTLSDSLSLTSSVNPQTSDYSLSSTLSYFGTVIPTGSINFMQSGPGGVSLGDIPVGGLP